MAKGKLFDFVVLYHPKVKKDNAGNDITDPSVVIVKPAQILAVADKEVGLKASRLIPAEYEDRLEDCEVIVRPF